MRVLCMIALLVMSVCAATKTTISFKSLDNIKITADMYMVDEDINRPMIVLFHQAGFSRGEYNEIAPHLNQLGFNAMAVDLRSGNSVNGVVNQTHIEAKKNFKKTHHLKARIDIVAALHYARKFSNKLILWGSSYSASLLLKTVGEKPRYAKAMMLFSAGEYFTKVGKPKDYIQSSASKLKLPLFFTSARSEKEKWIDMYNAIDYKDKVYFLPQSKGKHGSSALWSKYDFSKEYWHAVESFLKSLKL